MLSPKAIENGHFLRLKVIEYNDDCCYLKYVSSIEEA